MLERLKVDVAHGMSLSEFITLLSRMRLNVDLACSTLSGPIFQVINFITKKANVFSLFKIIGYNHFTVQLLFLLLLQVYKPVKCS